jgi:mRNA deadenylase 3'-5' endonuclease subunit Ccr4
MRIVQYNILSTDLATKFYYTNTDTKYLQPEARWLLLKEKLLIEIENKSILCLQEVSLLWIEKLLPFFQNLNYYCQYNNYDWKDTGYMGIMIAYPNQYKLEAVKIMNIGDQIETRVKRISDELLLDDVSVKAIRKRNMLLCLRLRADSLMEDEKSFCIGTYHMPPEYKNQDVATLHLVMCNHLMNKFAGNYKYILAGDFNFLPDSTLYHLITKGGRYQVSKSLNYDTSSFPTKITMPLTSVYMIINKIEPSFTNYVNLNEPFSGCLDYIFVSRGWKVNKVKELPSNLPDVSYPSGNEPSDHLMIAVELK